ncbi:unnamed protein product [Moneuplotes crassus]|uniref:U-box domain-containing protein n=1 Tax=Euplotes crassus TaxID=5936 RepID=A0AAD1Y766_EUPCR|nr:unnamed protein product [Moneuplotes crassus]
MEIPVGSTRAQVKSLSPIRLGQNSRQINNRVKKKFRKYLLEDYKSIAKIFLEMLALLQTEADLHPGSCSRKNFIDSYRSKINTLCEYPDDLLDEIKPENASSVCDLTISALERRLSIAQNHHESIQHAFQRYERSEAKIRKERSENRGLLESLRKEIFEKDNNIDNLLDQVEVMQHKLKLKQSKVDLCRSYMLEVQESPEVSEEKKGFATELLNKLEKEVSINSKDDFDYDKNMSIHDGNHCSHLCIEQNKKCFATKCFNQYYGLLDKLEELLICPISFELVKKPAITPSGNLVDTSVIERLIHERKRDPFDRSLPLSRLTPNRSATEVLNLIQH